MNTGLDPVSQNDVTRAIQEAIEACKLFSDTPRVSDVQLYLGSHPGIQVSAEQIEAALTGKSLYIELPGGGAIIWGQDLEVGFMQIQVPGKREAWMYWIEGGTTSEHRWSWGTRFWAIAQINVTLETLGLALNERLQITEF